MKASSRSLKTLENTLRLTKLFWIRRQLGLTPKEKDFWIFKKQYREEGSITLKNRRVKFLCSFRYSIFFFATEKVSWERPIKKEERKLKKLLLTGIF